MSGDRIRHKVGRVDIRYVFDSILRLDGADADSMNALCVVCSNFSNYVVRVC